MSELQPGDYAYVLVDREAARTRRKAARNKRKANRKKVKK